MPTQSPASPRLTGLVLAAGGSLRLGRPKQLLPYGSLPLLEHVLEMARGCGLGQLVCVLGGSAVLAACGYEDGRGPIAGRIPPDVDTWEDYRNVLAAAG